MADDMEAKPADYSSLKAQNKGKGGFRACVPIFVLIGLDNIGFIANMVSLVIYFMTVMFFDLATASTTLTNFLGSAFMLAVVGGFISDTFFNKYYTVLIFGFLEVVGLIMLTIQAYKTNLQPEYCGPGKTSCVEGGIAVMFYATLSFLAFGAGAMRGALIPFGGDQFDQKDRKEVKELASFFNWNTLSTVIGAVIGVTGVVYLSTNGSGNWWKGFLLSTVASVAGYLVFAIGKPLYIIKEPGEISPTIRIAQVITLAFKNRRLSVPDAGKLYETDEKESYNEDRIRHTNQFRFLDKAAIIPKDSNPAQWTVCSVTQVEELKILIRMLPILFSTIIMNTCLAQLQTFSIEQGNTMNLHLGKHLFPAASIPVIPLAFMTILIPIYDLFFIPVARKITGHPSGITQLQRVGVGLVLSVISMSVAGVIEVKRRNYGILHPLPGEGISLFWLSFQFGIFGIADMFTLVGLLEFFYKEAPSNMKSLSTSFTWLSLSFGFFLSSVFVNVINKVTRKLTDDGFGWLEGLTLNDTRLDYFYWFLAIMSSFNFLLYLLSAYWYKYRSDGDNDSKPLLLEKEESAIVEEEEVSVVQTNVAEEKPEAEEKVSVVQTNVAEEKPEAEEKVEKRKNEGEAAASTSSDQLNKDGK